MSRRFATGCLVLAVAANQAVGGPDPTRTTLNVPRQDVVMGDDIGRTDWPARLAHPNNEGQFEILVRKSPPGIAAPDCRSGYLVIRMPASVSIGPDPATAAAAARKQAFFRRLLKAYDKGEPLRADVSAGSYGRRDSSGTLVLTQCNLFFVEPAAPR